MVKIFAHYSSLYSVRRVRPEFCFVQGKSFLVAKLWPSCRVGRVVSGRDFCVSSKSHLPVEIQIATTKVFPRAMTVARMIFCSETDAQIALSRLENFFFASFFRRIAQKVAEPEVGVCAAEAVDGAVSRWRGPHTTLNMK